MGPRILFWLLPLCLTIAVPLSVVAQPERVTEYRLDTPPDSLAALRKQFTDEQLGILEKLNRADRDHLARLPVLVIPEAWASDELAYSVLPRRYPSGERHPKLLVVHLPGQLFGGYESGILVRWGPISSGARRSPTPSGFFSLNWKAASRYSTVDPDWFMPLYFNFGNREGLAFHQYTLPGGPASHGCIRLLQRDAQWLYDWGEQWVLDSTGRYVRRPGTPVLILGAYDFDAPPPWRSLEWLAQTLQLPPLPGEPTTASGAATGCTAPAG
jgi:hypothetical protein